MHTRADITFSVMFLSRFMETPLQVHRVAAKRMLRYSVGTMGRVILVGNVNRKEKGYVQDGFSAICLLVIVTGPGLFYRASPKVAIPSFTGLFVGWQ